MWLANKVKATAVWSEVCVKNKTCFASHFCFAKQLGMCMVSKINALSAVFALQTCIVSSFDLQLFDLQINFGLQCPCMCVCVCVCARAHTLL